MKKIILWIMLIILILLMCILSYIVFFNKSNEIEYSSFGYWESYKVETYNSFEQIVESSSDDLFTLNISLNDIIICSISQDECFNFKYRKIDDRYVMITDNEKLLNAHLKIIDYIDKDYGSIIQIIKTYDDGGYSIFYFSKQSLNNPVG